MNARSCALDTPEPPMRPRAVAGVVRKDMHLLGPYALTCAIWMFLVSALIRSDKDVSALMAALGLSGLGLDFFVLALFGYGLPVALVLFVVLLAQTDPASDARSDWLIRPVGPLELVAAKLATLLCVIVAPTIAGGAVYYLMTKAAPADEAFALVLPGLLCVPVLVLSWLVSTPFRAVAALLGALVLVTVVKLLAGAVKVALGLALAGAGGPTDPTPFAHLDEAWMVELVGGIGLYVVSGLTLWLLLARRKRVAARWLFVGYLAGSMLLQSLLFDPLDRTAAASAAPEAAAAARLPLGQ